MKAQRARERVVNGARLEAQGQPLRAEREYRAALELAPRDVTALNRLGLLLAMRGEAVKAAALFRRAALADANNPVSRENLGAALLQLGDEAGALEAYEAALALNPTSRNARLNVGIRLFMAGRLAEAREHYRRLVGRDPQDPLARWNVAALDGLLGDLDAAFAGFAHEQAMKPSRQLRHLPRWGGEDLAGRTLVLEAEQGLGDTIMFGRLAPLARERGGRTVLRVQSSLLSLISRAQLADVCEPLSAPVAGDLWHPVGELPALFGAQRALAAAPGPYLAADPVRCAAWRRRLGDSARLRVGLVWAGSPTHLQDGLRSASLAALLPPLAAIEGIDFVSLQKGPAAAQADSSPLIRADLDLTDFEDTAAALSQLDLLISVDTSVLHLAGALGLPAWGLLPFVPDWRWMMAREDSPWYPSLRLFRQSSPGDWTGVAQAVAHSLADFLYQSS